MEYFSAVKRNKLLIQATAWMNLKDILPMLMDRSSFKELIFYDFIYLPLYDFIYLPLLKRLKNTDGKQIIDCYKSKREVSLKRGSIREC